MGIWSKIAQGMKIGVQMAAPVVPLVNPAAAAVLQLVEVVVGAATDPTPEKAIALSFQTLGVPLVNYEAHVLADIALRVKAKLSAGDKG